MARAMNRGVFVTSVAAGTGVAVAQSARFSVTLRNCCPGNRSRLGADAWAHIHACDRGPSVSRLPG